MSVQESNPSDKGRDFCEEGFCCPGKERLKKAHKAMQSLPRREFLKISGLAAGGVALGKMPVMAGPFEANDYLEAIPADKKLRPEWVRSLFERGEKQTYSDPEALGHIGMPAGGFFTGTVYLSGDGRLWLWDIFNRDQTGILPREVQPPEGLSAGGFLTGGLNYLYPAPVTQPFHQAFKLRIGKEERPLDQTGFRHVTFEGRYPIGRVFYRDPACPIEVQLEAFSPFIPLNLDDSSLPVTIMSFKLVNRSGRAVEAAVVGELENAVCIDSRKRFAGRLCNRIARAPGLTALVCSAEPVKPDEGGARPDIIFEDFEKEDYEGWTVKGEAFGKGPIERKRAPAYQGDMGGHGKRVVNSHASAPGGSIAAKDAKTGRLISREFTVCRRYINLFVGGGAHKGRTCVNLLVEGKLAASVTGKNSNRMTLQSLPVSAYEGKKARIEIVDEARGSWGNIGVDCIVFSDRPAGEGALVDQRDFGDMCLAFRGAADHAAADRTKGEDGERADADFPKRLIGRVERKVRLAPGASAVVDAFIAWRFPNFYSRGNGNARVGHYYATRFRSALDAARYVARHWDRLTGETRRWVETWYDSTLPYWFLDRTLANVSTLATATCYRFADGRFWAWEGIGCCPGTCTHVWHYAQGPGRLFPELERLQRERVDFGVALHPDGGIGMRAGLRGANEPAHDGQCGRILGALREHQMSDDDAFLRRLWPKIKLAIEYMIRKDGNGNGIVEGPQPNTLDAAWHGKISFLASLYLAALRAGEAMAREVGDNAFAERCAAIAEKGAKSILELYNGEYFIQIEDPKHKDAIGVGPGCYIDQIFGQTWAHWVGLGRLFDRDKQLSALRALWKYNFAPDIGAFRKKFKRGRWYAAAGDAGLVMCTWPKGGQNPNFKKHWQYMYFNECMTGFEWQAASHMIWEGMDQPDILRNGLAVARAIHDRYDARLRNPYNEIECSDHYARAMASYGAYQAACGFNCHGPRGRIEFAPRLSPENFRAAFVAPEGWGTFEQKAALGRAQAALHVRWGAVRLKSVALGALPGKFSSVKVKCNGRAAPARLERQNGRTVVVLEREVKAAAGQSLKIALA
ncbi:MAG: hypothetical protein J7M29_05260 [Verrucomicrobia bacterium]|nr:hypothetical protein [Verrucomicrobiota bacterium]